MVDRPTPGPEAAAEPPLTSSEFIAGYEQTDLADPAKAAEALGRLPQFSPTELATGGVATRISKMTDTVTKDITPSGLDQLEQTFIRSGIFQESPDGKVVGVPATGGFPEKLQAQFDTILRARAVDNALKPLKAELGTLTDAATADRTRGSVAAEVADRVARFMLSREVDPTGPYAKLTQEKLDKLVEGSLPKTTDRRIYAEQITKRVAEIPAETDAINQARLAADAVERDKAAAAAAAEARAMLDEVDHQADLRRGEEQNRAFADKAGDEETTVLGEGLRRLRDQYAEPISQAVAAGDTVTATRLRGERDAARAELFGTVGEQAEQVAVEKAFDAATGVDREALAQGEVFQEFQPRIEATQDVMLRKQLIAERDRALVTIKGRIQAVNQKAASTSAETVMAIRDGKEITKTFDRSTTDLDEQAKATHEALKLEPVPFQTVNKGGWAHRKANRGPKVTEAYYRSALNPKLVIMERYLRRDDTLLSQTVFTTHDELQAIDADTYQLPRGFVKRVEEVRKSDRRPEVYKARSGDYVSFGSVDLGGAARGYGASSEQLEALKRKRQRRGWLFTLLGGGE